MKQALLPFSLERMARAVDKVQDRLLRATRALEDAGVGYAVAGGNAVAVWVTRVDAAAVRNTRDVDILLRRADLAAATDALKDVGFIYRHVRGVDTFLDGPDASDRDAVHVVFAGERVWEHELLTNPDVEESEVANCFRVLSLEALVQIKLTAFRDKDRTHLRDLIELEMIDAGWGHRFPPELSARLQMLINTPEG